MDQSTAPRGGAFLIEDTRPESVFTPEEFTEPQKMLAKSVETFVKNEVLPHEHKLVQKDLPLNRQLMLKAGELGMLGADIPEEYGGCDLDKIASTLLVAHSTLADIFAITWNCHTGIGTLPIVIFGNKAQKEKYLPPLARGAKIGAYALTEPSAGSDALSIKTRAVLAPDGKHYILNGEKMFITNGGLADMIVTYAKIDGDKFTSFIVERDSKGLSTGAELKKMGLQGSSTTSVVFEDVHVPVENVLHQIGRGHEVAFCILDMGRFKLAAACAERGKQVIERTVSYARQREQFGKPLTSFGLIQQKIADMAILTYMSDSMVYRTAGLLDRAFALKDAGETPLSKRISEYTVECSIGKVFCSEALDFITDEAIQVHGGYGYIEEFQVERMYRDSRINRIFEGTNEINRLLMPGWVLRKAVKNELPLFSMAQKLMNEIISLPPAVPALTDGLLGYQKKLVDMAKRIFILVCGAAAQKYAAAIQEQEEALGCLADVMIEVYAMESGLLRAMKSVDSAGEAASGLKIDMVRVFVNETMRKIEDQAVQVLASMETGDMLATQLGALKKLARLTPMNTIAARRRIATALTEAGKYVC